MNPFYKSIIIGVVIGFGTLWMFKRSKITAKVLYISALSVLTLLLLSAIEGDFTFFTSPFDWIAWRSIFVLIMTASAVLTLCLVNLIVKILKMKTKEEDDT